MSKGSGKKGSRKKGSGNILLVVLCCCVGILIAGIAGILILYNQQSTEQVVMAPVSVTVQPTVSETEKNRIAVATAHLSVSTPEPDPEAEYAEQALRIMARTTMLDGVTIGGIDVGGLTEEQAHAKLASAVSGKTAEPSFVLMHDGKPYTAAETVDDDDVDPDFADEVDEPVSLEIGVDIDSPIKQAFGMLRDGDSNIAIVSQASDIALNGYDIPLSFKLDKDDVALYVASIAGDLDSAPVNASVRSENKKLIYTDAQVGYGVDREALINTLMSIDPTEPAQIEIPMKEMDPFLTQEMLQSQYVLRGSYKTSFSGSTSNRKFNIRKGADLINGTVLQPGEVFSTNDTLGVRTKANGWKTAGAYESGKVVQQAGGGVCQLSGTLYNTAVLSDLEIVERRNHSMPVHYLDKGRDATINSIGNIIDFKFKNNTDSPIIVIGYTDGNELHFEIYGEPMGHGEYDKITIKTKQTGSTRVKTVETKDSSKPVGYEEVVESGQIGYSYESYKEYWKDGKKIRTEFLAKSSYKMFPRQVIIGTGAVKDEPVHNDTPDTPNNPGHNDTPDTPVHDVDPGGNDDPAPRDEPGGNTDPGHSDTPDHSGDSGDSGDNDKPSGGGNDSHDKEPSEPTNDSGNKDSGNSSSGDSGSSHSSDSGSSSSGGDSGSSHSSDSGSSSSGDSGSSSSEGDN